MSAPPGAARTPSNGITGTRTKAETNRVLTGTFKRLGRAAGIELEPWQLRTLVASARANLVEPTEGDLLRFLMSAPWFPKPHVRRFGVGDPGWRTST